MPTKFLQATLLDGSTVVSEFSKLKGSGQGYAELIFRGVKTFNAWKTVGDTHPVTGEKVLLRQRVMIAGHQIKSICQVQPATDATGVFTGQFEPVTEMQKGQYGMYVGPATNAPEGIVAGVEYPIHRDPTSLRRYVIVRAANGDQPEVRAFVDNDPALVGARDDSASESRQHRTEPGDADEDQDFGTDFDE